MNRKLLLLASLIPALASGAAYAANDRPRPENYANYSLYIQALVDYQRARDAAPKPKEEEDPNASKLCRDSQGDQGDDKKKNSCEGKYLLGEDELPDNAKQPKKKPVIPAAEAPSYESLDEAIARAQYQQAPDSVDSGGATRPAYNGVPLEEVTAQDLRESGVDGLLGLFDNVRLRALMSGGSGGGGGGGGGYSGDGLGGDGTIRVSLDDYLILFDQLASNLGSGFIIMANGYTKLDSTVSFSGDNGLEIAFSSETHTSFAIVDRDGEPNTGYYHAGALTIDQLTVLVPRMEVTMQGTRDSTGDGAFELNTYSPQPIYVNLANTNIGVADAYADGSRIGTATNFVTFGPQSMLTIAAGTKVDAVVSKPNGTISPFLTLNGRVGDISVHDISLFDNNSGGAINIGTFAVHNIALTNTKVFLDDNKLIIDAGRGLDNISFDIERLYLGAPGSGAFVGDFYASNGHLVSLQMTATPH